MRPLQSSRRVLPRPCLALALLAGLAACTSVPFDPDAPTTRRRLPGADEALLGVSGSYTQRESSTQDRESLDLRVESSVQASDEHEFGLWLLGGYSNLQTDARSRRDVWAGLNYHYHFYFSDTTSVFLGPTVGWSVTDTGTVDEGAFGYGAEVGLRHWVSSTAAFTFTPTWFRTDFPGSAGGSSDDIVIRWGLSFRL